MAAGALVLVGGLVTAFLVVGIWGLHRSLSRNVDENLVVREGSAPKAPAKTDTSALDELKKPLPRPDPKSVAVTPAEAPRPAAAPAPVAKPEPKRVPEGPPSKDPSRMDAEGFIRYWLVLGAIPADKEMSGAVEVAREQLPNEAGLKPKVDERVKVKGKEYAWQRYKSPDFQIDFRKACEGQKGDDVTAYAVAYLSCDEEMPGLKLLLGSNDHSRVYVNGKKVFQQDKSRTMERDQNVVEGVTLKKGQNIVIFKVVNEKNLWLGCLRFMDRNGTPIRHLQLSSAPQ